jgi:hypothetical protein
LDPLPVQVKASLDIIFFFHYDTFFLLWPVWPAYSARMSVLRCASIFPLPNIPCRWVDHVQVEGGSSHIRDAVGYFSNTAKSHSAAWPLVCDIDYPLLTRRLGRDLGPLYTLCVRILLPDRLSHCQDPENVSVRDERLVSSLGTAFMGNILGRKIVDTYVSNPKENEHYMAGHITNRLQPARDMRSCFQGVPTIQSGRFGWHWEKLAPRAYVSKGTSINMHKHECTVRRVL